MEIDLLDLLTLSPTVSASLPLTSYMKMVEVWLIFNLFIPFLEVLLHTYMDSLRCSLLVLPTLPQHLQ